jgi:alpha-glucosidase
MLHYTPRILFTLLTLTILFSMGRTSPQNQFNPQANPAAVVVSGNARFTVLTSAMLRMEYSATGQFKDRASFVFINRWLPVAEFTTHQENGWLFLETADLVIRYLENSGTFSDSNLSIQLKSEVAPATWHPGLEDTGNLGGTVRTLDQASGAIPLEPGLLSRDGWVLIDDSNTLLFDDTELAWATPRSQEAIDWYFFGCGHDYKQALYDFTLVSGKIPLPPRWSFGSWWSRYWNYTDQELKNLVAEFKDHNVPLDILVVDMDWHLEGWTGYTWNPEYFPDPVGFLDWCHHQNLKVTLNLHPHDGVKAHEAVFPDFARAMGLDPGKTDQIPFDVTDPEYMRTYFDLLHHPMEEQGVDFWWIDWQQGEESKIPGLDPLFWLNHLHWKDMENNPGRGDLRPMMFSRYGGLGSHRYQIGFSGDTHSIWESLAFQSYFTATAGNVCYPFWSHDIGGHFFGPVEPELYARWIQFAAFNPFLRTHATKNPAAERRIWAFDDEIFNVSRQAFHLRYELLPYIYTTARQCYDKAIPMCRPLYYAWPEMDEAYNWPEEYLFGDQMLVAPVGGPRDPHSRCAVTRVWIPPGHWHHWFTGKRYTGPAEYTLMTPLNQIPAFVKAGGIIPMMPYRSQIGDQPIKTFIFNIFPGDSGRFVLYDDDGISPGYQRGEYNVTPVTQLTSDGIMTVTIGGAAGDYPGMPTQRDYEIHLWDVWPPDKVTLDGKELLYHESPDKIQGTGWAYDADAFSAIVKLPDCVIGETRDIRFTLSRYNDSGLREGIRGRLDLFRELADRLGEKTPDIMQVYLQKPSQLLLKDKQNAITELNEQSLWTSSLAPRIAYQPEDVHLANEAFLRLVEIAADFMIEPIPADSVIMKVNIEVQNPIRDFWGKFVFSLPKHWNPDQPLAYELERPFTQPQHREIMVTSEGELVTASFSTRFTFGGQEGDPVEYEVEKTIFPSINAWWIVGPFHNPWKDMLDNVFPPESEVDLTSVYEGKNGQNINWQIAERPIDTDTDPLSEFFVDLHQVLGDEIYESVAYAFTYLHSPENVDAILALGSDDGAAVWLNGDEIHRHPVGRPYAPKQDRVQMKLKKGLNTLLIKINQGWGGWGFSAFIEDESENSLTAIVPVLKP